MIEVVVDHKLKKVTVYRYDKEVFSFDTDNIQAVEYLIRCLMNLLFEGVSEPNVNDIKLIVVKE